MGRFRQFISFLCAIFCLLGEVHAQMEEIAIEPSTGSKVYKITDSAEIPRFLYWWTKPRTLLHLANQVQPPSQWPGFPKLKLKKDGYIAAIADHFPQLLRAKHGVLFTWTNPVTALTGYALGEKYGEVLVRFEIDVEKAKALFLETGPSSRESKPDFRGTARFADYGLAFHDARRFQEWVLLNPSVIKSFTADPEDLRPELESGLKKLKNRRYKFQPKEIHANPFLDPYSKKGPVFVDDGTIARNYVVYRVTRFLEEGRKIIPDAFLTRSSDRASKKRTEADLRGAIHQFTLADYNRYVTESLHELKTAEFLSFNDLISRALSLKFARDLMATDSRGERLFSMVEFEELVSKLEKDIGKLFGWDTVEIKKSELLDPNKSAIEQLRQMVSTKPTFLKKYPGGSALLVGPVALCLKAG